MRCEAIIHHSETNKVKSNVTQRIRYFYLCSIDQHEQHKMSFMLHLNKPDSVMSVPW